jgi:hypothetical protein
VKQFKGRVLFLAGILVFLLAKIYLIIPTTLALNIPRTGDDALVYLWKGKLMTIKNSSFMPAINDIEAQFKLPENNDLNSTLLRSRIAGRTLGHTMSPIYDALMAISLKLTPDLRWAYSLAELLGLLLMTVGIGWFFYEICGPAIAGITLTTLSFAILPNQGIASFIPSTVSLSCSLILWAYLWRAEQKFNMAIVGISALLILGLHPIAKVYIALTPILYWLRLNQSKNCFIAIFRLLLSLGLAGLAAFIFQKIFINLHIPASMIMGNINLIESFFYNQDKAIKLIGGDFIIHNMPWFFLMMSGLLFAPSIKPPLPLIYLAAGSIGMLFISLFFMLPGYPAELFSRLLVFTFFVGSAIGAYRLALLQNISIRLKQFYIFIYISMVLISAAWWVIKYVPGIMNGRHEIILESPFVKILNSIPNNTSILYAEADITLQAALLLGGDKYGAIVYPMLKGTNDLEELIKRQQPQILLTPSNTKLNSLAQVKAKKFLQRLQGLSFEYVKELNIKRRNGYPLDKILLKIKKAETEADDNYIDWKAYGGNNQIINYGRVKIINEQVLITAPPTTEMINISLPKTTAWLIGLDYQNKRKKENMWPWESNWHLNYVSRYKKNNKTEVNFSIFDLLKQVNAEDLTKYVDLNEPIISDESGIVFIRTIYNQKKK